MKTVLLAAGGTGGHLFPAEALAHVLAKRGVRVILATDDRGLLFGERFPAAELVALPSGTLMRRDPKALLVGAWGLAWGFVRACMLVWQKKPDVAVGFGGYPSVPPLMAMVLFRRPVFLHEQNAVLGRANAFLARFARRLATGFPDVVGAEAFVTKIAYTGNPVRQVVLSLADRGYAPPEANGPLRVVVFGGSQGARVMGDLVVSALCQLPEAVRARLHVVQQARPEDLDRVRASFEAAGIKADVAAFFVDLPHHMAEAHLVVARSGASSVSELSVLGRPCVLLPLQHSLDQDQAHNAAQLAQVGAAVVLKENDLSDARLAGLLQDLLGRPDQLRQMAEAARSRGVLDAAERLAAQVMQDS